MKMAKQKQKLFVMTFTQDGEDIGVSTKIVKKMGSKDLLQVLKTGIVGMLETAMHTGKALGLNEEQINEFLFDE